MTTTTTQKTMSAAPPPAAPTPTVAQRLRAPFPPERILQVDKSYTSSKTGKFVEVKLDYVGHADITDRLLEVDPYWYWEPLALTPEGFPAMDTRCDGTVALWIKLTVHTEEGPITRIGVGTVPADARELYKELIGDALRNSAMRFGVALDLWRKDVDTHPVAPDAAPAKPAAKAPAPRKPYAGGQGSTESRVEVLGVPVIAYDFDRFSADKVGGNGKKKDLTWLELSSYTEDNERYLEWMLENVKKDLAANKPVGPWASKAVLALARMKENQSGLGGEIPLADDPFGGPGQGGEDGMPW